MPLLLFPSIHLADNTLSHTLLHSLYIRCSVNSGPNFLESAGEKSFAS